MAGRKATGSTAGKSARGATFFNGTAKAIVGLIKADPKLIEAGADDMRVAARESYLHTVFQALARSSAEEALDLLRRESIPITPLELHRAIEESRPLFRYDAAHVTDPTASPAFIELATVVQRQCSAIGISIAHQAELQAELRQAYQEAFFHALRSDATQERFTLADADSPFHVARKREAARAQSERQLAALVRQPLLTDDLLLEDTYIPPRGIVGPPCEPWTRQPVS